MSVKLWSQLQYLLLAIISLITFRYVEAKLFNIKAARSEVVVEDFMNCPDYLSIPDIIHANVRKHNRTVQVLNLNVTLSEGFTNSHILVFEVLKWGNGGWKNNYLFLESGKACTTALRILGEVFKSFIRAGGQEAKCPVPKGDFQLDNMPIDFTKAPIIASAGRFKVRLKLKKDKKETLLCADVIVDVKSVQ